MFKIKLISTKELIFVIDIPMVPRQSLNCDNSRQCVILGKVRFYKNVER